MPKPAYLWSGGSMEGGRLARRSQPDESSVLAGSAKDDDAPAPAADLPGVCSLPKSVGINDRRLLGMGRWGSRVKQCAQ